MTEGELEALIFSFPGAEAATSYGQPAYKVDGKFLTRLRAEDHSLVLSDIGFDEREMLMEAEPEIFHLTPHYAGYPNVLARLDRLDAATLLPFLERRFRKVAKKATLKAYEAQTKPR